MNFYEFTQNNSGGEWKFDDKLCHRLFIEARTKEKATEKAILMGVYFDGVEEGQDCSCCGDRWSEPDEIILPKRHGTFNKELAEKIAIAYKADCGQSTWGFRNGEPDPDDYDVVFRDVESYAQFIADNYSTRKGLDSRIFYTQGTVLEIMANHDRRKRNL